MSSNEYSLFLHVIYIRILCEIMNFLRLFFLFCTTSVALTIADSPMPNGIKRLIDGNNRWVYQQLQQPDRDASRLESTISKQEPFAIVVCCSDS